MPGYKMLRWMGIAAGLLTLYFVAYGLSPRQPAVNMAYFVYSEDADIEDFCYYFFMPAYDAHKAAWTALHRPFTRHSWDRPELPPEIFAE